MWITYDYPLTSDKIEIKKEMLSNYHLKIANFHNIPLGTVKKFVPEKYVLHDENLKLYFKAAICWYLVHHQTCACSYSMLI